MYMSSSEEGGIKKPFQFVDRRRFDSDGNERDSKSETLVAATVAAQATPAPVVPQESKTPHVSEVKASPDEDFDDSVDEEFEKVEYGGATSAHGLGATGVDPEYRPEASENPDEDVTLTSFIMSLATQTMVQLGEMDPPTGMEIPMDVEAARQTVDIISMLQRKTKGNLSADESRFIVEVLHTLRMSYVRKAK